MTRVVKIDKVGLIVDFYPFQRFVVIKTAFQYFHVGIVWGSKPVAVHAGSRWWDGGMSTFVHHSMAVPTVEFIVPGRNFLVKPDWLVWGIAHIF
jgi:hypothetical protein